MKYIVSTVKRINRLVNNMDMSYIRWSTLSLIVFCCTFSLVVCFVPYADSNGESILLHFILELIE